MKTKHHNSQWLLEDAGALYQMNRKYGAILLLLCAVDALAREADPNNRNVGERFKKFLCSKMRREGRAQIHNIEIPQEGKFYTFENLIYKFLRNPLVHEGARLETDHQDDYAVCIDWENIPYGLKVDSEDKKVILGGELVFNILEDAVQDEIKRKSMGSDSIDF